MVVQPSRGFWLNRPLGGQAVVDVLCEGGALGVTRLPWGIPEEYQGKIGSLDIAAAVRYPQGKGRMLRFRDGMQVGKASLDGWHVALTVAGLLSGKIVMSRPAQLKMSFPESVDPAVRDENPILTQTLWRPGDDEPQSYPTGEEFRATKITKGEIGSLFSF